MKDMYQRAITRQTPVVIAIALSAVAGLALYRYFSEDNNYRPPADSILTGPGVPNQTIPSEVTIKSETPPLNSNTAKQAGEEQNVKALITGTVKIEGAGGQAVTSAVVILFNGDKRGADPQLVDASGRFHFQKIPIRAENTYSLQTKVPGLCGEENFTLQDINAQRSVSKDIILKPCHDRPLVPPSTKPEDPQLARISDGLSGMKASLDSIRGSFTSLVITSISTVTVLLAMAGLVIFSRRQAIDDSTRIKELYEWKQLIELKKSPQSEEKAVSLLELPASLSQTLDQLLTSLERVATSTREKEGADASLEGKGTGQIPQERSEIFTIAHDQLEPPQESLQKATRWYQNLLYGRLTVPNPLYFRIDIPLSNRSPVSANRRICFDQTQHQGPFVVFRESNDSRVGWIFPNPASNFVADHTWVFSHLSQVNFEQQKADISPRELQFREGKWQLTL